MKTDRILATLLALTMAALSSSAQTQDFKKRYDMLVSRLGPAGVGIESLIGKWQQADSTDVDMLVAAHDYYFEKSKTLEVRRKDLKKYLGAKPVVTLKDSTGNDVNYFQEPVFDDSLYSISAKYIDKAVRLAPERLDLRTARATSLVGYEKDSPDMAGVDLEALVDEFKSGKHEWQFPGAVVDDEFFCSIIQEYCYAFFTIDSPTSMEIFRNLSLKMVSCFPKSTIFMSNVGSYYLMKEDFRQAVKYYKKVLKVQPDDYTAIRNCVTAGRRMKDVKLEKKYLQLLIQHGSESDKQQAQARLDALQAK